MMRDSTKKTHNVAERGGEGGVEERGVRDESGGLGEEGRED